jgi:hypothetical protein
MVLPKDKNQIWEFDMNIKNKTRLNEGLDYKDMVGQLEPLVSVDDYAAKMGPDNEIVTLSFIIKSKLAGEDLVLWLEKGYEFVLDASLSEGELSPGKWVVFAEMKRRSKVPERIIQILTDLETLTDIPVKQWKVQIDDKEYSAKEEIIKEKIILNPNVYKTVKERAGELNEMRHHAGLETKKIYNHNDPLIRDFIAAAGL